LQPKRLDPAPLTSVQDGFNSEPSGLQTANWQLQIGLQPMANRQVRFSLL
jgi:hypothetical protein